jgi:hypothetical protein
MDPATSEQAAMGTPWRQRCDLRRRATWVRSKSHRVAGEGCTKTHKDTDNFLVTVADP